MCSDVNVVCIDVNVVCNVMLQQNKEASDDTGNTAETDIDVVIADSRHVTHSDDVSEGQSEAGAETLQPATRWFKAVSEGDVEEMSLLLDMGELPVDTTDQVNVSLLALPKSRYDSAKNSTKSNV